MRRSLVALLAALAPALACAQQEDAVVVTATRAPQPSLQVPASVDRIEAGEIREGRPQVNLSESLGRVPGIVVQNRQNYAQDLQISSRGFGARATFGVRGIRLIADGIPATMPDGQGQAATFALSSAERIEVLRGPFSALYGNASGGVIAVETRERFQPCRPVCDFEDVDAHEPAAMGVARVDQAHEIAAPDRQAGKDRLVELRRRAIHQDETPIGITALQRVHLRRAHRTGRIVEDRQRETHGYFPRSKPWTFAPSRTRRFRVGVSSFSISSVQVDSASIRLSVSRTRF